LRIDFADCQIDFLYSEGDLPNCLLKLRVKCVGSLKPNWKAMSAIAAASLESGLVLSFYLEEKPDEDYENYLERSNQADHGEFRLGAFHLSEK
jgi:hypothetical protein